MAALSPPARLKREGCQRTKHDSAFSRWQVLIGPSDWEDYSQGKEGAARYRVHNLPITSSAGVYELGIAVTRSGLGRYVGKLDPDDIVVVYLGQADNVRTRLQSYGRSGAHLADIYSTGHWDESNSADSDKKRSGLFEEIFYKGYPIVFRWAPMKDKRDAERTEAQLLDTFDYAWNKGTNDARRPDDILQKLDNVASSRNRFTKMSKRLLFLRPSQVGIKIEASEPLAPQKGYYADEDSKSFLPGIFKFSRFRPTLVSEKSETNGDITHKCGFIMNDGIPCRKTPVAGRKRCEEHKGMRIYRNSSKFKAEANKPNIADVYPDPGTRTDQDLRPACGVKLGDQTFCGRPVAAGRKRCEEHRGMRINSITYKLLSASSSTSVDAINNNGSYEIDTGFGLQSHPPPSSVTGHQYTICGATLGNGSFCRRQPVRGNKRCWQHKGQRINSSLSGMASSSSSYVNTLRCGVTLFDGSICSTAPVNGRKRCEQHKGMRVTATI